MAGWPLQSDSQTLLRCLAEAGRYIEAVGLRRGASVALDANQGSGVENRHWLKRCLRERRLGRTACRAVLGAEGTATRRFGLDRSQPSQPGDRLVNKLSEPSMMRIILVALWAVIAPVNLSQALAEELPHIARNGQALQLIVDGSPYLIFGGELHNSSPSSPEYMADIWDRLARNHVKTVIGAASWELVEPSEGQFDFSAVDDQIRQARVHNMRLVLIWFGAYKNAESSYAPSWVRRNEARFPRAERRPPGAMYEKMAPYFRGPVLSLFGEQLVRADGRAFAALMRHIKQVDPVHTIIMIQVENETGLLLDSRDRSPLAEAAWKRPVPLALIRYMEEHRQGLRPELRNLWAAHGYRTRGSWSEVFGDGRSADEIFMAWSFGQYVDRVAREGAAELALPMYVNAWLPEQAEPGLYPSGGPVARMSDVWKAAAPSISLLAPDIYIRDFAGALADFKRSDNPIFVPEARFDAGNLFIALGEYNAVGFSPFGIEDGATNEDVFGAYAVIDNMTGQIARAQAEGRIRGFSLSGGHAVDLSLDGYSIKVSPPPGTLGAFGAGTGEAASTQPASYGLIMGVGPDTYLAIGRGVSLEFTAENASVEVDSATELVFKNGEAGALRTLNGDERGSLFPRDSLAVVRLKLLRRQNAQH